MARPSLKTPKLIEAICARLETGEPLAAICRDDGMPNAATVWKWEQDDDALRQAVARAREIGGDAIAERALEIADDLTDDPASRRVRVETRLKLLACWHPKRYGTKVGIGQAEGLDAVNLKTTIDASKLSVAALTEIASLATDES